MGEDHPEDGDEPFESDFNIDYQIIMYKNWSHTVKTLDKLIDDAKSSSSGDKEYEALLKKKGKRTWRQFILETCQIKPNERKGGK